MCARAGLGLQESRLLPDCAEGAPCGDLTPSLSLSWCISEQEGERPLSPSLLLSRQEPRGGGSTPSTFLAPASLGKDLELPYGGESPPSLLGAG